uniref:Uncharacterized protein n=1 Tax=Pithovirus LCPAC101 TaxID=2506586 RepID=A0A481Z2N6_9VIRU|nr:MAG: hypothetical protein LCPAC101_02660 [Pithovirus LCPAC101]
MSFLITSPNLDDLLADHQCTIPIVTEQREYTSRLLLQNNRIDMIEYIHDLEINDKVCTSSTSSTTIWYKIKVNLNDKITKYLAICLVKQKHIDIIVNIINIINIISYKHCNSTYEITLFDDKKSSDPYSYSYDIIAIKIKYSKKEVIVHLNIHRGTDIEK